jgi:hypothetical protein
MPNFDSPFIIPLAGMLVGVIAIVSSFMGQAHSRRLKAEQRMAMIARGMKSEEIALLLGEASDDDRPTPRVKDPMRSLANARRAGIVLCSVGIGLVLFFCVLASILGVREVYSGAAVGLIPIAIGIGFFIDCHLQKKEMARFGLELDPPHGA